MGTNSTPSGTCRSSWGGRAVFYVVTGDGIAVSSSLVELIRGRDARRLDIDALNVFHRLGFFLGEDTPLSEVKLSPVWRVWADPRVWGRYARLVLGGERIRGFGEDTLQLGGDFVVGSDGVITYSRPQRVDDRPPAAELLRALSTARCRGGALLHHPGT